MWFKLYRIYKDCAESQKGIAFKARAKIRMTIKNSTYFMKRAIELAKQAEMLGEVPVGAVVIDPIRNAIVGEGKNLTISNQDPTAHAEIVAIRQAAEIRQNYRLPDLDIYVTLEPCAMCAGAISQARLARLFFAALDSKGGAVVNGVRFFEQESCHSRPEVYRMNEFSSEIETILKTFFRKLRSR